MPNGRGTDVHAGADEPVVSKALSSTYNSHRSRPAMSVSQTCRRRGGAVKLPKAAGRLSPARLAPPEADDPADCTCICTGHLSPSPACKSCIAAQAKRASTPAPLSCMPGSRAPLGDGTGLKPWHETRYIPEIRLDNATSVRAFRGYDSGNKVIAVNYFNLKKSCFCSPKKGPELRRKIGPHSHLILICTGADRELDRFTVKEYDAAARAVGADAVTTPEDYVYDCDNAYPEFQHGNLLRAKSRTSDLLRIPNRPYPIIGLVTGQDRIQQDNYMDFLTRQGVNDLAFPCSDYLKGGHSDTGLIDNFVRRCRASGNWAVLLGISSTRLLLRYKPPSFSNSAPCFDHAYHRSAGNCALDGPVPGAPANLPVERCQDSLRHYASLGARWGA